MPYQSIFDDLRQDGRVNVNTLRRIGHSASDRVRVNYQDFKSRVSTVFKSGSSRSDRATAAMDASLQVLDTVGQVLTHTGTAAATAVLVATAVSGAAFVAAISGPQAALAMGLLGLVLAARAAYSNRDAAHDKLRTYTWSFLTSTKPTALTDAVIDEVADAAFTLLEDGKAQMSRLHEKFETRAKAFNEFNKSYIDKSQALADARAGYGPAKAAYDAAMIQKSQANHATGTNRQQIINQAQSTFNTANNNLNTVTNNFNKLKKELDKMWNDAITSGGAIFEFSRRCIHASNYIQAAEIVHIRSFYRFRQSHARLDLAVFNSHFTGTQTDFYTDINTVTAYRNAVAAADAAYRTIWENKEEKIDSSFAYTPPTAPTAAVGIQVRTP